MAENEYLRVMLSFKESVAASIAASNQETPRSTPLDIHICIGPDKTNTIREVRKRLPSNTFLFYLSVGPEAVDTDRYVIETGELTYITNWPDDLVKDKVAVLIMLIGGKPPRLSILNDSNDQSEKAKEEVEKGIQEALRRQAQSKAWDFIYFRNSIANFPLMRVKPSYLMPKINDCAVVCAGGPSLTDNIDDLKRNRANFVLISVRRSLAVLLDAGMTPDFVVETDPLGLKYSDYEKIDALDSTLVVLTSASPYTPTLFKKIMWCEGECVFANNAIKEQGGELGHLAISNTCTVSAIDLAVKMGCSRIALLGNDLGFSVDKSEYSSNSLGRNFEDEDFVELPSTDGGKIMSSPRYVQVKEIIERFLNELDVDENVIYNCTTRGAKIDGANEISLASFFSQNNSRAVFDSSALTVNSSLTSSDPLKTRSFDDFRNYVELLKSLTESLRKLIRELSNSTPRGALVEECQHEIRQKIGSEQQLVEQLSDKLFAPALKHRQVIVDEMFKPPKSTPLDELKNLIRVYEWSFDLCDTIRGAIEKNDGVLARADDLSSTDVEECLKSPLRCGAYARYAIRFVKTNNRDYAEWLMNYRYPAPEDEQFYLILEGSNLPSVFAKDENGKSNIIAHKDTNAQIARQACHDFFTTSQFDPENNAIVLLGPGNWQYALEINRQYPYAYLIVLDPWPALFAEIIRSSMFLHRFWDERTVVIGMDRNIRSWKRVYHKTMREWSKRGLKPLFFKPRKMWEIPYVANAFDDPIFS